MPQIILPGVFVNPCLNDFSSEPEHWIMEEKKYREMRETAPKIIKAESGFMTNRMEGGPLEN